MLNNESYTEEQDSRFEDLEDELFPVPSGKGGGGKKKNAPRDPKSKTAKAQKQQTIEASREKKKEESAAEIKKVLQNFPQESNAQKEDAYFDMYVGWVNASLKSGMPLVDDSMLDEEFMRSGRKAGGQNVNKVNSAVRLLHVPTNISVRNEETRDQVTNRETARRRLSEELLAHLDDWKTYLTDGKKEISRDMVMALLVE